MSIVIVVGWYSLLLVTLAWAVDTLGLFVRPARGYNMHVAVLVAAARRLSPPHGRLFDPSLNTVHKLPPPFTCDMVGVDAASRRLVSHGGDLQPVDPLHGLKRRRWGDPPGPSLCTCIYMNITYRGMRT